MRTAIVLGLVLLLAGCGTAEPPEPPEKEPTLCTCPIDPYPYPDPYPDPWPVPRYPPTPEEETHERP